MLPVKPATKLKMPWITTKNKSSFLVVQSLFAVHVNRDFLLQPTLRNINNRLPLVQTPLQPCGSTSSFPNNYPFMLKNICCGLLLLICCAAIGQRPSAQGGFVAAGNFRVYYQVQGTGAPLLLLHAGLQNHSMWAA